MDTQNWAQLRHLVCGQSQPALRGEQVPSFSGQALSLQVTSREEPAVPTGQLRLQIWGIHPPCCAQATHTAPVGTGCRHIPSTLHKGGTHCQGNPPHFPIFPLFYTDQQVLPAVFRVGGKKEARNNSSVQESCSI